MFRVRLSARATILPVVLCLLICPLSAASVEAAQTWNYTALGDSLAFGILDLEAGGYVPRYGAYIQVDNQVTVQLNNLGRNGWTSAQLLNALRVDASFRQAIAASQVVTWDIGGNDFLRARTKYQDRNSPGACGGADNQDCFRSTVAEFKQNWAAIMAEILSLRSPNETIVRTMDIYNPFVVAGQQSDSWADDGGLNDFQALKPYIDEVNTYIAATSAANNIPCARVSLAFNGPAGTDDPASKGYLTFDGVHPNEVGHQVIAELFRALSYAPLNAPPSSLVPILLTQAESPERAIALDSVTFMRDPFPVVTSRNFSPDLRTRVMLFASGMGSSAGASSSSVTVQAEDAQHRVYALTVEFVGKVAGAEAITQVNIRLADELSGAGDVQVSISVGGVMSNKALIAVGP